MNLKKVVARQAVAEWRDLHLIGLSTLLNHHAVTSRDRLDRDAASDPASYTALNAANWANRTIDRLMFEALAAPLPSYVLAAAKQLAEIDDALAKIAAELVNCAQEDWETVADSLGEPVSGLANVSDEQEVKGAHQTTRGPNPFLQFSKGLGTRASGFAARTASAVDSVAKSSARLDRHISSVAAHRVRQRWLGLDGQSSILAKMADRFEFAANASREMLQK